eukprot:9492585-Pyramimonas_sp.AAC.1
MCRNGPRPPCAPCRCGAGAGRRAGHRRAGAAGPLRQGGRTEAHVRRQVRRPGDGPATCRTETTCASGAAPPARWSLPGRGEAGASLDGRQCVRRQVAAPTASIGRGVRAVVDAVLQACLPLAGDQELPRQGGEAPRDHRAAAAVGAGFLLGRHARPAVR